MSEEKNTEINIYIIKIKNKLSNIEKKLETNKEHFFCTIQLINICMSKKLDIKIPFLNELNIPDYIITNIQKNKISKLSISLSNIKNKVGKEHGVLIKNLDTVVKLLSYDYINYIMVRFENVKWKEYIDISSLHLGMFKFDIYEHDQEVIYPNNIRLLEIKSYCKSYQIDLFYVNNATEIELSGDFNLKSLPKNVNSLILLIEEKSSNTCKQLIMLINEKHFNFNKVVLKCKNIEQLNDMLIYLDPTYYFTENNLLTMSNFETDEVIHMYNVHVYKKVFTPLGGFVEFF